MAQIHKCSHENCPTGSKIKCVKCGKQSFMPCFGLANHESIDNNEIVKIKLPNGGTMFAFVSSCAFVCCSDGLSKTDLKKTLKAPKAPRSTSSNRNTTDKNDVSTVLRELSTVVNDLAHIKEGIEMSYASIDVSLGNANDKLDIIRNASAAIYQRTTVLVDQATRPVLVGQKTVNTPNTSKSLKPRNVTPSTNTPKMSYANVAKSDAPTHSTKRRRTETMSTQAPKTTKFNAPPPRVGTKIGPCSLAVPLKVPAKKFEKAVWVSRFLPHVTDEQVIELVQQNTSIKDQSRIKVHKLVKKDRDVSTLKFVSFKIESNADDSAILNDPDVWPEGIMVRPFLQDLTLGDHFPALHRASEDMDTDNLFAPSVSPKPMTSKQAKQSPNKIPTKSPNQTPTKSPNK